MSAKPKQPLIPKLGDISSASNAEAFADDFDFEQLYHGQADKPPRIHGIELAGEKVQSSVK